MQIAHGTWTVYEAVNRIYIYTVYRAVYQTAAIFGTRSHFGAQHGRPLKGNQGPEQ